ncbi:hypothetical protein [Flagellimonas sediminis]|uniref:Lipocalin-like domain-containing protein n=1 Tax=Flagellimonas sediminis TaxID=2696468 RepID=A0A6I5KSI7_9FLAO|nr:hypothetical protein [Allomuricauda sediminis]NDV43413.1 hypothetical protein [Allomuricauda sediminis]
MNKIYFLLLIVILSACQTSEDIESVSEEVSSQLIGPWELVEITSEEGRIGSSTASDPNYFEILYTGEGTNLDTQLTFTENPNALDISGEGFYYVRAITEVSGNIEISGDPKIEEQWTFAYDFLAPGRGWKVEEGKFIFDHVEGSLRVDYGPEILELNETALKLKIKYNKDYPKTGLHIGQETCIFYCTLHRI